MHFLAQIDMVKVISIKNEHDHTGGDGIVLYYGNYFNDEIDRKDNDKLGGNYYENSAQKFNQND